MWEGRYSAWLLHTCYCSIESTVQYLLTCSASLLFGGNDCCILVAGSTGRPLTRPRKSLSTLKQREPLLWGAWILDVECCTHPVWAPNILFPSPCTAEPFQFHGTRARLLQRGWMQDLPQTWKLTCYQEREHSGTAIILNTRQLNFSSSLTTHSVPFLDLNHSHSSLKLGKFLWYTEWKIEV